MKKLYLLIFMFSIACGGNLSDEQRKKLREGMEQQKIVRITDDEIVASALDKGHQLVNFLEQKAPSQSQIDSLESVSNVKIHFTTPGSANALAIEQQLIEAYIAGIATGDQQENLQKIYTTEKRESYDSLLYSKPKITRLADGTEQLEGIWNIYISKKNVVLEITKTK
jgi:hypothetical protein